MTYTNLSKCWIKCGVINYFINNCTSLQVYFFISYDISLICWMVNYNFIIRSVTYLTTLLYEDRITVLIIWQMAMLEGLGIVLQLGFNVLEVESDSTTIVVHCSFWWEYVYLLR